MARLSFDLIPGETVVVVTQYTPLIGMGEHNSSRKHNLMVNDDLSMGSKSRGLYLDPRKAARLASGKVVSIGPVTSVSVYDSKQMYPIGDSWKPGGFGRLASSDRKALVKLAGTLPKGSAERRAILGNLKEAMEHSSPEGLVKSAGMSSTAWDRQTALGIEIDVLKVSDLEEEIDQSGDKWQRMDLHINMYVFIKTSPGRREHEIPLWGGKALLTVESKSGDWADDADLEGVTMAGAGLKSFYNDLVGMWLSDTDDHFIQGLWDYHRSWDLRQK